ncbi:MAG: hypothetical protein RLO18_10415, partial [Gimesia chilikensis]
MAIVSKQILKTGLLVISLFAFAACSSTSDVEEDPNAGQSTTTTPSRPANTNAGSSNNQPTAAEIARDNALRTTVFYF